jgi:hypothetical protein
MVLPQADLTSIDPLRVSRPTPSAPTVSLVSDRLYGLDAPPPRPDGPGKRAGAAVEPAAGIDRKSYGVSPRAGARWCCMIWGVA